MLKLLKKIVSSRVGLILVGVHLCLVLYAFRGETRTFGDECFVLEGSLAEFRSNGQVTFHWYRGSILYKTIILLDLPSMVVAAILLFPFGWILDYFCFQTAYWIINFWMLFCASVQWLLIGYAIERFYTYRKNLFK